MRQTVDFNIDIVDDSINEKKGQFIVLVGEPTMENPEEDFFDPDDRDRLFAVVTINIDADYPDSQSLSLSMIFSPLPLAPFPSVCPSLSLLSLPLILFHSPPNSLHPETQLRISAPSGGSMTISEGTTGWFLLLTIEAYWPEHKIEVNVDAKGTCNNPAEQGEFPFFGGRNVNIVAVGEQFVHCREVVLSSGCPLSEVLLHSVLLVVNFSLSLSLSELTTTYQKPQ